MSAALAIYDMARRAWRTAPTSWPVAGMMRSGRVTTASRPVARTSLASTHLRWPTLMRWDGWIGCGKFKGNRPLLCHMLQGRLTTAWSEWLMGFPNKWTARV